jgi:RHS repeat-associated protein
VWQATTIDEYSRLRAANIGATAATWTYSTTTNMLTQIKGTGVQQYDYDFSGTTGNLSTRTNGGKSDYFGYDTENLDRLVSVNGVCPQTLTYQPANKGNINTKSDAGTYSYDATRKYAVNGITTGQNISTTSQLVTYNVFNKVATITEGTKTADFVYNADRQRIRMTLKTSGATTKTCWYFGGSCEREVVGSTTTQYIWIGGDAYTAVAVAKKVGTGSWTVYNIFRDHLGTITHLKNGSTIDEYSFDAWGRRRDKDSWSYTLSGEPALFADRGFTSHEFLADFNLYNMNGRLYDPVVGRFLSPDPYIQAPSFSQSYNRYAYALNNPLKYNDPTGEKWRWGNPFYHFDRLATKFMDWVNRKAEPVNDFLVKHNAPSFGGGYNSTYGAGFYVGNNPMYYPGYEKRIATGQGEISNQIAGFSGWDPNSGSPRFGNGDIPSSIYASSVVLNIMVSAEEINTGLNLTSTLEKANAYKSILIEYRNH